MKQYTSTLSESEFGNKIHLNRYMQLSPDNSSILKKEKEVINLAVSKVSKCGECLEEDRASAILNGFTSLQIQELIQGNVTFDTKLDALAKLSSNIILNRGTVDPKVAELFFEAGWTEENYIDVVLIAGDKSMKNKFLKLTQGHTNHTFTSS